MPLRAAEHAAITDLAHAYDQAVDSQDPDSWADTFTDDRELVSPFGNPRGRAELHEWIAGVTASLSGTRNGTLNEVIDGNGNRATMCSSYFVVGTDSTPPTSGATGGYTDDLIRVDGRWRFTRRRHTVDASFGDAALGESAAAMPRALRRLRATIPPPSHEGPARPGAVLLVLCLAQFILVLDISVTNVALASIRADLGFAVADLQWIVTAYTLAFGSLLIFFGRAGDLWGRRRLFLAGTAVFTIGSLACALAQAPWQMVAARAVQGLGGAMMSPAALSLLTSTFPEGEPRNRALAVWGAIAAGGAAAGMIIGGVLTDLGGWRWVFLINVPVGAAIVLTAPRVVAESRSQRSTRLDVAGAATVTAGLAALVYGLSRMGSDSTDGDAPTAWLTAAALLLTAVALLERRSPEPLVDFGLLRRRGVAAANVFSLLSTAVVIAQSFFLSLYLRDVLNFSPLRTGFALVPITLVVVAVASAVPRVLPRVGVRVTLGAAGMLLAVGMVLQARMPAAGSYAADVLPAIMITAAGLGLGLVAATIAATSGVDERQQGLASGLLTTAQQIGGALGVAVLATLAAARTGDLLAQGQAPPAALTAGFSLGFTAAAVVALLSAAAGLAAPRRPAARPRPAPSEETR